jgi:hypothetical protein
MKNRTFRGEHRILLSNVITTIEKDNYMDIITASVGVSFTLCLAALAVTPTLLGVYLELRAQKRHDTQQNAFEFPSADPSPVPFNYPQILSRKMPREADQSGTTHS